MTRKSQKYYGTLSNIVWAVIMTATLAAGIDTANAQTKGKPDQYLKAGIKSLNAGKSKQAIDQLTKAVQSGSLSNENLARALYQRGKAYRANNQQGLAIADLTNALYLKALPKKEQEALHLERARAFSSVGLQGQTSADIRAATGVSAPPKPAGTQPATQNQKPAAAVAAPSPTASTGATSPIVTGSIQQPAPAIAPVPPAPQSGFDPLKSVSNFFDNLNPWSDEAKPLPAQNTTGWQTTQQQTAPPAGQPLAVSPKTTGAVATTVPAPTAVAPPPLQTAPAAAPKPVTNTRPSTAAANNPSNRPVWMADPTVTTPQAPPVVPLVIHDGTKKAPAASQQTTATIPTAPKAQTAPVKVAPTPVRKPVRTTAQPAFRQAVPNNYAAQRTPPALKPSVSPQRQVAVAPSVAPVQSAQRARPKLFQLMVGAGRTEQQARYVWKSLQAAHPQLLSGLTPNIHAKSRPGLGSYYIVGLGPFEDQVKSQKVCDGFKKQRLPCSVVPH